MADNKDRFQVSTFFDTPVTLPIQQLLDWSPQLRVQLAYAIASSWPIKRGKKSAGPNPIGVAATASKFWAPPAIETMAHKDQEVICFYIDTQIEKQKLSQTFVNFGAVVQLISQKLVYDLNL